MIWWIVLAVYVVGYLACWRSMFLSFRKDDPLDDSVELMKSFFCTAGASLVWPIYAFAIVAMWTILREPESLRQRRRNAHITEMEQKLGIGQPNPDTSWWDDVENMQDYQIFGEHKP